MCQIDFFRAALQGRFKEASTKLIKMPEDDPLCIACLVQFQYTHCYPNLLVSKEQGNLNFLSGVYHARILAVAEKYGCHDLFRLAAHIIWCYQLGYSGLDWLELQIELYEISGDGSPLRLDPKGTSRGSDVWDNGTHGQIIKHIWEDPATRHLIDEASQRCPDLGSDIAKFTALLGL